MLEPTARSSTPNRIWRVAQWATGNVGSRSLRGIIEHPRLELVGVHVFGADKVGVDAGTLAGIGETGIKATGDIDAILAAKPDAIIFMPRGFDADTACRFLEAGINIVTTRDEVQNPYWDGSDRDLMARVQAACEKGGATIHATGSSPGWISEQVPLTLATMQRRLKSIRITEYADVSSRNSPEMLFDLMGFGKASFPPEWQAGRVAHLRHSFAPSIALMARALGISYDRIEAEGDVAMTTQRTRLAAGVVEAGTIGAMRTVIAAMKGDDVVLSQTLMWFCCWTIDKDWPLRESGWNVRVDGDVPLNVDITYPVSPEDYPQMTPGLTANPAVNAVVAVCEARPGIATTLDLPRLVPQLV